MSASPCGPSPLAGVAYGQGLSLIRFTEVPADERIDEFVGRFAVSSGQDRARLRSALTMDDFYTVLGYARRAAVRTMRNGDGEVASRGVAALAVLDPGSWPTTCSPGTAPARSWPSPLTISGTWISPASSVSTGSLSLMKPS